MSDFLTIDIKGFKADLPILPLPSGVKIAFFNLHGDAEMTEWCGKKLAGYLLRRAYNRRIERFTTYARCRART